MYYCTYYCIQSRASTYLFPTSFAQKCHSHHQSDFIYRALEGQDNGICLNLPFCCICENWNCLSFDLLYCLSVCEKTSVLSVYCRKHALQLLIVSMVKKHINIFNWRTFILKKYKSTISVILHFSLYLWRSKKYCL